MPRPILAFAAAHIDSLGCGWTIKQEIDPVVALNVLVTFIIGIFVFLLGKRFTTRRYEREYVITLLKDFYPIAKGVHESFGAYRLSRAPITIVADREMRARLNALRDQVKLVSSALAKMKKNCRNVSADTLSDEYRAYKRAATGNTLGHTKTFDLTLDDTIAEDNAYQNLMELVHSFIFELNVI